jgi:hypothetical protein
MLHARASYGVLGRPSQKRKGMLEPDGSGPSEAWYIDGADAVVAARWSGDAFWMSGATVLVDGRPVATELGLAGAPTSTLPWAKLDARRGRFVAIAGAARMPTHDPVEREALLAHLLDVPPQPTRRGLARLFGPREALEGAAALIVDFDERPEPAGLLAWVEDLSERDLDLSWAGNESGPGLVQVFRRPLGDAPDVREALLDHARGDAKLAASIREFSEAWLEDHGGDVSFERRLVQDDPARGWVEALEIAVIAPQVRGGTGAWLEPGTPHARRAWRSELPGAAILAALCRHVEQPAIVEIQSEPEEEPVLALHLIGGIDPSSRELVGFALSRVWT